MYVPFPDISECRLLFTAVGYICCSWLIIVSRRETASDCLAAHMLIRISTYTGGSVLEKWANLTDILCDFPYFLYKNTFKSAVPLGYRSRYRDWLRAGRPSGRNSSPGMGKIFLFFTWSRPVSGLTQAPIQ
jgi:hypothetical protein